MKYSADAIEVLTASFVFPCHGFHIVPGKVGECPEHGYTQNGLAEEIEGWSEATCWCAATVAKWASRRSAAEGLDRSATLGAEKRHATESWHRSVSGVSFRRVVLSRMSQDKPMQRARSCGHGGRYAGCLFVKIGKLG